MSHANAQLTPRARLRLERLIVEDGWTYAAAARMFMVASRTARKWAERYRAEGVVEGVAGMADRSSRPRNSPVRTPEHVVRRIVRLRWRHRLGPVQISGRTGVPASTVYAVLVRCRINRLARIDRVIGDRIRQVRRYEHDRPGSLIHVDVTKFGNIPDGGGWRLVGRQQGDKNKSATSRRTGKWSPDYHARTGTAFLHTVIDDHSTVAYWPTSRSVSMRRPPPQSECCNEQWPGSPNEASPSNACCPTTARPTAPTPGARPAPSSRSPRSGPGPTGHRPTANSNDSTYAKIENTLNRTLALIGHCDEAYRLGGPNVRRMFNHFFFEQLLVEPDDDHVKVTEAVLNEPMATLLSSDFQAQMAANTTNPDRLLDGRGSKEVNLVPPAGHTTDLRDLKRQVRAAW